MAKNLPNIILFVPDEMRGDCVSLWGTHNSVIKTPNIDNIAKDGIAFTKCFNVNPVCVPSRCCTFTGQYVHSNAHRSLYQLLKPYEQNLFKLLKAKGYQVVKVGRNDLFTKEGAKKSYSKQFDIGKLLLKNYLIELLKPESLKFVLQRKNFRQIIDMIINRKKIMKDLSILQYPMIKELMGKYYKLNPYPKDHPLRKSFYYGKRTKKQGNDIDSFVIKRALKYLDSKPKQPFCLYIALNFPHPPYTVEEPFFYMYDRDSIPDLIPPKLEDKPEFMKLMHKRYGLNKLKKEDFKEIRATYYGMISRVDYQFGKIIKKLKEIGKYQDTAMFFFADHGDYTGDYGLTEKWPNAFQDCLTNIPLILKIPGIKPHINVSDELIQSIDIFKTILDIAEIKTNYTHFSKSLIPLLKGDKKSHRDEVFAEGGYNLREPQCFEDPVKNTDIPLMGIYFDKTNIPVEKPDTVSRSVMIRTKEWKLIIRNGIQDELYDLKNDPSEIHNLINDEENLEIINKLKNKLLIWYLNTSDNPGSEKIRNL
jgi:choline-sulfatase